MQNNYGGFVEYATLTLLVLQIVWGRAYLKHRRPDWPRPILTASIALMVLMWGVPAASALFLTWTGFIYTSRIIPVALRAAIVAIGYFWMLLSWLGILIGRTRSGMSRQRSPISIHPPAERGYVLPALPQSVQPYRRAWPRSARSSSATNTGSTSLISPFPAFIPISMATASCR